MALNCDTQVALWGSLWGVGFGEGFPFVIGGELPTSSLFDIFCVCGPATPHVDSFLDVQVTPGDLAHNFGDPSQGTYVFQSADSVRAGLYFDVAAPASTSMEISLRLDDLPIDLATGVRHIYFGIYDDTSGCAGIFLSQAGIGFAGCYDDPPAMIPNSAGLVEPYKTYIFRIVIDNETTAAYVYFEEEKEALLTGLKLRFVLPVLDTSGVPVHTEGVYVSALGTALEPTTFSIDAVCLSSQALVDDLPPVANPGPDQTVLEGSVIKLDGRKSSDAEGSKLSYEWRVIDAPSGSRYCFEGADGTTLPDVSGFVDKLYSEHAIVGGLNEFLLDPGDVITFQSISATYLSKGVDVDGPYFLVEGAFFPAGVSEKGFRAVTQDALSDETSAVAKFIPDIEGIYRFDLRVRDATLASTRSVVLANVLRRDQVKGFVPDASPIWNYLGDTWSLVEERGRIESVWSGLLQVVGAEILRAWQGASSRSLNTVPRSVQRRWLNYDLLLREPFPDLALVRSVWRGVVSSTIALAGLAISGQIVLSVPGEQSLTIITIAPTAATSTAVGLAAYLQEKLREVRPSFTVSFQKTAGATCYLRLVAPFPFSVLVGTTALFTPGDLNSPAGGVTAQRVAEKVLKVEYSLSGMGVRSDDLIAVRSSSGEVRVVRALSIQDVASDAERYQRIVLRDSLPGGIDGEWAFLTSCTSPQLQFWAAGVSEGDSCILEVTRQGESTFFRLPVIGVVPDKQGSLGVETDADVSGWLGFADSQIRFWGVYRQKLLAVDPLVVSIPSLQENPWEDDISHILQENVDYEVTSVEGRPGQFVSFRFPEGAPPIPRLWAEETFLDNSEVIESNFGYAVEFTRARLQSALTNIDYLSAVQGLWFARMRGPRIGNLRIASQILLGLPFAEEPGTIIDIDTAYSPTLSRIVIQSNVPALVRTYTYPRSLDLEINPATRKRYAVGDAVQQFAPLVEGVSILDYVKDPTWYRPFTSQGLLSEVEKLHSFLVRVDLEAFSLSTLGFVDEFLRRVKPARTKPLFVVRKRDLTADTVDVTDTVEMQGNLHLFLSPYALPAPFWDAPLPNTQRRDGSAAMFDQPDPSPGIVSGGPALPPSPLFTGKYSAAFDTDLDPTNAYPTTAPDQVQGWGFDRQLLGPEQGVKARLEINYDGLAAMTVFEDIAAAATQPLLQGESLSYGRHWLQPFDERGLQLFGPLAPAAPLTVNYVQLVVLGVPANTPRNLVFRIYKNGNLIMQQGFLHNSSSEMVLEYGPAPAPNPLPVAPFNLISTDLVQVAIHTLSGEYQDQVLKHALLVMGSGVSWSPGGPALPAGIYYTLKTL